MGIRDCFSCSARGLLCLWPNSKLAFRALGTKLSSLGHSLLSWYSSVQIMRTEFHSTKQPVASMTPALNAKICEVNTCISPRGVMTRRPAGPKQPGPNLVSRGPAPKPYQNPETSVDAGCPANAIRPPPFFMRPSKKSTLKFPLGAFRIFSRCVRCQGKTPPFILLLSVLTFLSPFQITLPRCLPKTSRRSSDLFTFRSSQLRCPRRLYIPSHHHHQQPNN